MRGSAPRRIAVVATLVALLAAVSASSAQALTYDRAAYPTGLSPWSVASADFNGDSDPDLVVANLDSENISILLGGPGASFTGPTHLVAGFRPIGVAVGDFNADSDPDIAVANNGDRTVSIFLGGPGASFTGPVSYLTAGGSENVIVADFNGDGDPDLAVPNRNVDNVSVLLGEPGGTFSLRVNYPIGPDPLAGAAADFNGDGDPDLAISNYAATDNLSILEGQAGGTFGPTTQISAGKNPVGVATGEFSGDSDPDLAVTNFQGGNVSVMLGAAGSGFSAPTNYPTHAAPHAVAVGDLNGDSDPDLAVANTGGHNVSILLGAAGSTFIDHGDFAVGSHPRSVVLRDFDQDGRLDMAFATDDGVVTLHAVDSTSLSIDDVVLPEGDSGETDFTFTVRPSGPTSDPTAVTYRTVDGTATVADSDYTAVPPQTLTLAPHQAARTVTVKVRGDTTPEADEDFRVVLSDPVNAGIADGTGVGGIADDDFPGYARPRGASPLRVPLVPAYVACGSPNRTHAPPLAFGSCNPPQPQSSQLTVGTPDANGATANSIGSVRLTVLAGNPSTPADEADTRIATSLTDVRRSSDLTDHAGDVLVVIGYRLTDRVGSGSGDEPQTVQDSELEVVIPCAPTGSTAVGSTCALTTTVDALVPGAVVEAKRSIWAVSAVQVHDGGADGDVTTRTDNALFATQGIFVP